MADAWYLPFDGVNDSVDLTDIIISTAGSNPINSWELEFSAWVDTPQTFYICSTGQTSDFIALRNDNTLDVRISNTFYTFNVTDVTDPNGVYRLVMLHQSGSNRILSFFENGIDTGQSFNVNISTLRGYSELGTIGGLESAGNLKYIRSTDNNNSANNRDYFNNISGTEATLPNSLGADGTLVGFTSPPPWVLYDDGTGGGGVTADGLLNIPALTVSSAASATLPQPSASGTFNLSALTIAGNTSATLPQPDATGLFNLTAPAINGASSATFPQPSASGAFNLNAFNFTGSLSATGLNYSLIFSGGAENVSFNPISSSNNWNLKFSASNTTTHEFVVIGSDDSNFDNFIIIRNTNEIEYRRNNVQYRYQITDHTDPNAEYEFQMREGSLVLIENGVASTSQTIPQQTIHSFNRLGSINTVFRAGRFEYLELEDIDTPANNIRFDADTSNGTGTTLLDTIGSNNGTLNNFNGVTDSWWVLNADQPNTTLTGAFSLNAITIAGNATATTPNFTASGAFDLPALTATGSANSTQPNPTASGNFDIGALLFSGASSATLPQPLASAAFNLNAFNLTGSASVTEPTFTASGAFNIPAITASGSGSATFPQPSASGSFALPQLQINGNITVSGLIIRPSQDAILYASVGDGINYIDNTSNIIYLH